MSGAPVGLRDLAALLQDVVSQTRDEVPLTFNRVHRSARRNPSRQRVCAVADDPHKDASVEDDDDTSLCAPIEPSAGAELVAIGASRFKPVAKRLDDVKRGRTFASLAPPVAITNAASDDLPERLTTMRDSATPLSGPLSAEAVDKHHAAPTASDYEQAAFEALTTRNAKRKAAAAAERKVTRAESSRATGPIAKAEYTVMTAKSRGAYTTSAYKKAEKAAVAANKSPKQVVVLAKAAYKKAATERDKRRK